MIRAATPEDLTTVLDRCRRFHSYSPWRNVEFDSDAMSTFALHCMENGAVFLSDDGLCAGVLSPLYFNPATTIAVELAWWAPSEGQGLRAAFEIWAKEMGATMIQFSALADEHLPAVTRLYGRAGYFPAEAAFLKRV